MAGIRKKKWKTKTGEHVCYEITYYVNGKLYRKSGFKTKLQAQQALPEITDIVTSNATFEQIANKYINRHCEIECKQSTIDLYKQYLKVNLKNFKLDKATDIKKKDIESLLLEFKKNGLSNKTINNIMIFISAVYNYGIDIEILSKNPCNGLKTLRVENKGIHVLSEEEIELFLQKAKEITPDYYALFATAIYTGMRRGELLALTWQDINFKDNTINIDKQLYKGQATSTKTTSSTRKIDMSQNLANILREYRKELTVIHKLVFCMANGRPLHAYNMSERYYKKVLKSVSAELPYENDIEKLRFHDLRHTHASYLLSNNVPVKYVQNRLGHSSSKVTIDTYWQYLPSDKGKAMDVLSRLDIRKKVQKIKNEQNMSIKN